MNKIVVFTNGRARQIPETETLLDIMDQLKLSPTSVLVERNGEAVLRSELPKVKLQHGDRLEFVRVVAGG